jgi:hypothetical protein
LAKNARSDQTEVEFNPSSIGGQYDPRVNAENQTAETKDQQASRCRSQAAQTAGEAGIGADREEGKGKEREGEKGKGERRKSEKRKGQDGKVKEVKLSKEELGRQDAKAISACAGKIGAR